ncbi:MAG: hypothetical protein CMF11_09825 [Idiomarina sp.]|nr:hypothetical protein [Idiomarina sp.]
MSAARPPNNEAKRLAALKSLQLLGTPAERRFDRLTRTAAHVLDAPIALVSLVDEDRLWFKSHYGIDVCEAPRDFSFCSHTLDSTQPLIIPDVAEDPRFVNNIFVKGSPGVRFYIGIPLRGPEEHIVGTLCVIDTKPRQPEASEIEVLQDLAEVVENELQHLELQSMSTQLESSNQKLAAIILASPLAIITCDMEQRIDVWNPSAAALFGVRANQVANQKLEAVSLSLSQKLSQLTRPLSEGEIVRDELFDVKLDGENVKNLDLSIAPLLNASNKQIGFTIVIVDVTEREQLLIKKEQEHKLLEAVLNNVDAGVAACDESGALTFFNRTAQEYVGEPVTSGAEEWAEHYQVFDATGERLLSTEELPLFRAWMGETVKDVELIVRPKDKPERTLVANASAYGGGSSKHAGAVVVLHDITTRKRLEQRLKHQAKHDSLTELPNRAAFMEILKGSISRAKRSGQVSALLFLDLDGFKAVNDTHGHHAGDEFLKIFAEHLRESVRESDTVARLAGDEFVIIVEQLKHAKADCRVITEKLLSLNTSEFSVEGGLTLKPSIGIALHRGHCSAEQLLKLADAAMYKAKKQVGGEVFIDDSCL